MEPHRTFYILRLLRKLVQIRHWFSVGKIPCPYCAINILNPYQEPGCV
jgi:hypothetical protein